MPPEKGVSNPALVPTPPLDILRPANASTSSLDESTGNLKKSEFPSSSTITNTSWKPISITTKSNTGIEDGKQTFGEDENTERGNWTGKLDFLLSCLGYAVGLGNVWRFPYLCYRNGGGAFFIPYIIMLIFVGIPLFLLEMSLGQFTSSGPLTCWEYAPLLKGIGVAQLIVSAMVAVYYNMIIAWSLFYLGSSFTSHVPWEGCDNTWNTPACSLKHPLINCAEAGLRRLMNGTCYNGTQYLGVYNESVFASVTSIKRVSPSEEYYRNGVLALSKGVDDMGSVRWQLALSLLGVWIIAFCCMIKGIKSSGKVVYFTALFPYVVLIILFGRGVSLKGAAKGIYFYIVPKMERLADAKVWNDAAVQIFFSLSNCWGGLIALASYNRFHNNVIRDTLIISLGNCLTSVFAGFVIFSFLGFMAEELNTSVEDVVDSGHGLAFIVYPSAVTRLPITPLWAILFFLMLIALGLDTQFAMLETVLTSILDQFGFLRPRKSFLVLAICILLFLLGLPLCTNGGAYMLQLMDTYCGGWALLIIGILESTSLMWLYGWDRFRDDIKIMINRPISVWWRICWQFLTPALIVFVLLFTWIDYTPARYGDYQFPAWADGLGWCMTLCSIICVPIVMVYKIVTTRGSFCRRLTILTQPSIDWGPALVKHRRLVDYVDGFVLDPRGSDQGIVNFASIYSVQPTDVSYNANATIESSTPSLHFGSYTALPHGGTPSIGGSSVTSYVSRVSFESNV